MLHRYLACSLVTLTIGMAQVVPSPNGGGWFTGSANQQSNAAGKRYSVTGTVFNALTGAPIARAVVRLQGMEPSQTFSTEDGHFELKDVLEGRVTIQAERPGFPLGNNRGSTQQVTVGSSTASIQLKLMPQSSLRGRVLSSDGDPIEGIPVQVFRRQILNGVRDWLLANGTISDETGAFAIEDLPPGAYLVRTGSHRVFPAAGSTIVVDGRHYPDLFPAQYFPNAPDRTSAQAVQVQPGLEAQADFTLTAVPSYSASGSVSDATKDYNGSCETSEGEVLSNAFHVDRRTGRFTMAQLPAGGCVLKVHSGFQRNEGAYGELQVNIGSTDASGLQLAVSELPDIAVTVAGGTATSGPNNLGFNVQLISQQLSDRRRNAGLTPKGDAQVFASVLPGTYRVTVQPFGASCVASVTSGSVDLLRSELIVSPGGSVPPIAVTLRSDCGTITAKIEGAAMDTSNIPSQTSVLIVPDGAPSLARMITIGSGAIQLSNLTPGDYTVYAGADFSDLAYAEPEALKGLEGKKVTVGPNAQVNVQLQLTGTSGETR